VSNFWGPVVQMISNPAARSDACALGGEIMIDDRIGHVTHLTPLGVRRTIVAKKTPIGCDSVHVRMRVDHDPPPRAHASLRAADAYHLNGLGPKRWTRMALLASPDVGVRGLAFLEADTVVCALTTGLRVQATRKHG